MKDFRECTVYEIYPKSFLDTNGDGLGELRGVTRKLDYLKELGVDYLWLTPFFVSPQNDNGYDVADYRRIDPRYGTMEDFEELSREAARRGIGLMLDMVFNHTSTDHEWFRKALAGDPKYKAYYIFKKGKPDGAPPTNWESKFGGSAWEYLPQFDEYYLHLFDKTQADLNWDNPEVRQEVADVVRFWMDKGVRGFRFDVINLISKGAFEDDDRGDGRRFYTDGPRIHEYLQELNQRTFGRDPGIITVGEMSSTTMENCFRYAGADGRELSMVFSFHHLKVDFMGNEKWVLVPTDFAKLKEILFSWQSGMAAHDAWNAVFWCNHDQPRVVSRFGDEGTYWKQSAKMLADVIHCLRGTPYIYQGEEIGMTNAGFTDLSVPGCGEPQPLPDPAGQGHERGERLQHPEGPFPRQFPHPDAVDRRGKRRLHGRHALDLGQPQLPAHQCRKPGGRPGFHLQPLPGADPAAQGVCGDLPRGLRPAGPGGPGGAGLPPPLERGHPVLHQQFLPQTLPLDLPRTAGRLHPAAGQLPRRPARPNAGTAPL